MSLSKHIDPHDETEIIEIVCIPTVTLVAINKQRAVKELRMCQKVV